MQSHSNELSSAIVLFIGFGSAPSPRRDRARLVKEFGATRGAAIESRVVALVNEVDKISVDWSKYSLESAGHMVRAETHTRHPDLTDTTLRVFAWQFTFEWR